MPAHATEATTVPRADLPSSIAALLFDADGVVLDTERLWDIGNAEFLAMHGCHYDRDVVKPHLTGRSMRDGSAILKELFGLDGPVERLVQQRFTTICELMRREAQYMQGFESFFQSLPPGFPVALATSLSPELVSIIDGRLGLADLFRGHVVTSVHVLRTKPAPDLFLAAADGLRVPRELAVVIEDAPLGVEAAHRAGMQCVALTTTYPRERLVRADVVADSFDEMPAALRMLGGVPAVRMTHHE